VLSYFTPKAAQLKREAETAAAELQLESILLPLRLPLNTAARHCRYVPLERHAMRRKTYTACHEAGHAVIGRVLGLLCGSATVVPDAVGFGCTTVKSPLATLDEWDARGRSRFNGRDLRSIYRAYVMELMAGREAAELCCGSGGSFVGDSDDIQQIDNLIYRTYHLDLSYFGLPPCNLSGDFSRLDRLRKATRGLCIRHREKIERVAQALIKHRTLSPEAIEALMRGPS
jgi:ATP-dependent Zn protease